MQLGFTILFLGCIEDQISFRIFLCDESTEVSLDGKGSSESCPKTGSISLT